MTESPGSKGGIDVPKDSSMAESLADAERIIADKKLQYPIKLIPWGEEKGRFYYVNLPEELAKQFGDALSESGSVRRVHVFSAGIPNKDISTLPTGKHDSLS